MIRVLVADDHAVVRVGLRRILEEADGIRVVGEAVSGDEALERLAAAPVDVLLLDISMPGPGVLEVLRRAAALRPALRILQLAQQHLRRPHGHHSGGQGDRRERRNQIRHRMGVVEGDQTDVAGNANAPAPQRL